MRRQGLSVITCTGDRPEAFDLCIKFVLRQTWRGPLQWIVVDDGVAPTNWRCIPWSAERGMLARIYPRPSWSPGSNTLARNLLAAIPEVIYDRVLFVEDDDWYARTYFAAMAKALDGSCQIVGDPHSFYYHLPSRRYRTFDGVHCSLAQTGIRAEMLPFLMEICERAEPFIDVELWRQPWSRYYERMGLVTGMKGLPGRPGIGIGHRPRGHEWIADPRLDALRARIGDDDLALYQYLA